MNKAKELDRLDKKIARTKELQKELDHRKEVEDKVFALFAEGKFEEGKALLGTLDDEKVMELAEDDVAAEEEKKAGNHSKDINIKFNVDTTQLDESIEKMNLLIEKNKEVEMFRNKEIEININCPINLSEGTLKKILDRVTEETKDYSDVMIRIGMS